MDPAPQDWVRLGPVAEFPDGQPVRRFAGETAVFVLRRGDEARTVVGLHRAADRPRPAPRRRWHHGPLSQ
jgi:hypothetical protein